MRLLLLQSVGKRITVAGLIVLGVVSLSGCGAPTVEGGCAVIDEAVDQTVISVADVVHDEQAIRDDYTAAADEVEQLMPGLRDAVMSGELTESQEMLLERMAELVDALEDENAEYVVTLAADMQRIQVALDPVCSNL